MPPDSPIVRTLTVHPTEPNVLFAGTSNGLFRSDDAGRSKWGWKSVSSTPHEVNIWSVAIDPSDPDTVFVGTSPAAVLRSRDGGFHFEMLIVPDIVAWCDTGTIRTRQITIDPSDSRNIFAGLEVDGMRRSLNGGDTWEYIPSWDRDIPDVHQVQIVKHNGGSRVIVTGNRDLYISDDMGESWQTMGGSKYFEKTDTAYTHWSSVKADDPRTVFVCAGNGAVGDRGRIFRTKDNGSTWEELPLPVKPNSTMYHIETTKMDPNFIAACSCNGQVYFSEDAGDSWRISDRVFGELHCISIQPSLGPEIETDALYKSSYA